MTRQAATSNPEDAAAQYSLALDLFEQKKDAEGFATLDRAVALDPGYAEEYLELAKQGLTLNRQDKSIELLQKADAVSPDNPFIRIELASQLIQVGRVIEARPILAALRDLPWSVEFHREIPNYLKQMSEAAAVDTIAPPPTAANPSGADWKPASPAADMPKFNHMGMGLPGK